MRAFFCGSLVVVVVLVYLFVLFLSYLSSENFFFVIQFILHKRNRDNFVWIKLSSLWGNWIVQYFVRYNQIVVSNCACALASTCVCIPFWYHRFPVVVAVVVVISHINQFVKFYKQLMKVCTLPLCRRNACLVDIALSNWVKWGNEHSTLLINKIHFRLGYPWYSTI